MRTLAHLTVLAVLAIAASTTALALILAAAHAGTRTDQEDQQP